MTLRVVALVSGRGSNLRAIMSAVDSGTCAAKVVGVVSDRERAAALTFAREAGIPTSTLAPRSFPHRAAFSAALADEVARYSPELVVLAGFMRILTSEFIYRFQNRIINVHPSLLPSFPGMDGPSQAIAAGVKLSGCTVHLVDEGVDTGPILAQAAVRVHEGDTTQSLHQRIQKAEHLLLPTIIDRIARDGLAQPSNRVSNQAMADDVFLSISAPS